MKAERYANGWHVMNDKGHAVALMLPGAGDPQAMAHRLASVERLEAAIRAVLDRGIGDIAWTRETLTKALEEES